MSLSTFLQSAAGTCPFCNHKAGILSREHPDRRRTYQAGWNEMVRPAPDAAASNGCPLLPGLRNGIPARKERLRIFHTIFVTDRTRGLGESDPKDRGLRLLYPSTQSTVKSEG